MQQINSWQEDWHKSSPETKLCSTRLELDGKPAMLLMAMPQGLSTEQTRQTLETAARQHVEGVEGESRCVPEGSGSGHLS